MMAHVWNEIEHDLGYKPVTGSLSEKSTIFLSRWDLRFDREIKQSAPCLRKPSDGNAPTAAYSRMSTISWREFAGGFRISISGETQGRYTKLYNLFVWSRLKAFVD
jgi:hypothetical protein